MLSRLRQKKFKLFFTLLLVIGALFGLQAVLAASAPSDIFGINPVGQNIGLGGEDIRLVIARIIRIFLGILGIIAIGITLYGGFVYMTSGGNEEKIAQARKIIVNGVIGIVIILSAFAIASFIINQLASATGAGKNKPAYCSNGIWDAEEGETDVDCGGACGACGGCSGTTCFPGGTSGFYLDRMPPGGQLCVRNYHPTMLFNKNVNISTLQDRIQIVRQDDQTVIPGQWVKGAEDNIAVFNPIGDCSFTKGRVGGVTASSTKSYFTIPANTALNNLYNGSFTYSFWIRVLDWNKISNYEIPFNKGSGGYPGMGVYAAIGSSSTKGIVLSMRFYGGLTNEQCAAEMNKVGGVNSTGYNNLSADLKAKCGGDLIPNTSLKDNNWHQVTLSATVNTTTPQTIANLYLDGKLVNGPLSINKLVYNDVRNLTIGQPTGDFLIDEFRVYTKALSASAVSNLFNTPTNVAGDLGTDLLLHLTFDDNDVSADGKKILDKTNNHLDATWNGTKDSHNDCLLPGTDFTLKVKDRGQGIKSTTGDELRCNMSCTEKRGCCGPVNFKTGINADYTPPIIFTIPDGLSNFPQGQSVPFNVGYRDDTGVDNIGFYVDESFYTSKYISGCSTSGTLSINLPTKDLSLGAHMSKAVASDQVAQTASTSRSFNVTPKICASNTGGACLGGDGDPCNNDSDCAYSYKCIDREGLGNKVCAAYPLIEGVSPFMNGASGNWITIYGKNFGDLSGVINFKPKDSGLKVPAKLVDCKTKAWNDTWVLAEVPENLALPIDSQSGIELQAGYNIREGGVEVTPKDDTINDWGIRPGGEGFFEINDIKRPGLCQVITAESVADKEGNVIVPAGKETGLPGIKIKATGKGFREPRATSANLYFSDSSKPAKISTWKDGEIAGNVPENLVADWYGVFVSDGAEPSNRVPFRILDQKDLLLPIINSIDPSSTTPGSLLTINGIRFGTEKGRVFVATNEEDVRTCTTGNPADSCVELKNDNLPSECGNAWSDEQIITSVPKDIFSRRLQEIKTVNLLTAPVMLNGGVLVNSANGYQVIEVADSIFSSATDNSSDLLNSNGPFTLQLKFNASKLPYYALDGNDPGRETILGLMKSDKTIYLAQFLRDSNTDLKLCFTAFRENVQLAKVCGTTRFNYTNTINEDNYYYLVFDGNKIIMYEGPAATYIGESVLPKSTAVSSDKIVMIGKSLLSSTTEFIAGGSPEIEYNLADLRLHAGVVDQNALSFITVPEKYDYNGNGWQDLLSRNWQKSVLMMSGAGDNDLRVCNANKVADCYSIDNQEECNSAYQENISWANGKRWNCGWSTWQGKTQCYIHGGGNRPSCILFNANNGSLLVKDWQSVRQIADKDKKFILKDGFGLNSELLLLDVPFNTSTGEFVFEAGTGVWKKTRLLLAGYYAPATGSTLPVGSYFFQVFEEQKEVNGRREIVRKLVFNYISKTDERNHLYVSYDLPNIQPDVLQKLNIGLSFRDGNYNLTVKADGVLLTPTINDNIYLLVDKTQLPAESGVFLIGGGEPPTGVENIANWSLAYAIYNSLTIETIESQDIIKPHIIVEQGGGAELTTNGNEQVEIDKGAPLPGICKIEPEKGLARTLNNEFITLYGINFSADPEVYFNTAKISKENRDNVSESVGWLKSSADLANGRVFAVNEINRGQKIKTYLPVDEINDVTVASGPVKVKAQGKAGNGVNYEVLDCTEATAQEKEKLSKQNFHCCEKGTDRGQWKMSNVACTDDVRDAGYVWRFFTGSMPRMLYVMEECDTKNWGKPGVQIGFPSPIPSERWNAGGTCKNATVAVRFNMEVNDETINKDNVKLYDCGTDSTCSVTDDDNEVPSNEYDIVNENKILKIHQLPPNHEFTPGHWYQVELSNKIEGQEAVQGIGADGQGNIAYPNLAETKSCGNGTAYCYKFKVNDSVCVLTGAGINPPDYLTQLLGIIQDPRYAFTYNLIGAVNINNPLHPYYYHVWGLADQKCTVLNADGYDWQWSTAGNYKNSAQTILAPSEDGRYKTSRSKVKALGNTAPDAVGIEAKTSGIILPTTTHNILAQLVSPTISTDEQITLRPYTSPIDGGDFNTYVGYRLALKVQLLGNAEVTAPTQPATGVDGLPTIPTPPVGLGDLSGVGRDSLSYQTTLRYVYRKQGESDIYVEETKVQNGNWVSSTLKFVYWYDNGEREALSVPLSKQNELINLLIEKTGSALNIYRNNVQVATINLKRAGANMSGSGITVGAFAPGNSLLNGTIQEFVVQKTNKLDVDVVATNSTTIDLLNPEVVYWWPNCGQACVNGSIGVQFNSVMATTTFEGGLKVEECLDEFCLQTKEDVIGLNDVKSETNIYEVSPATNLNPNSWYKVTVLDTIKAIGSYETDEAGNITSFTLGKGVKPHIWRFRTKEFDPICKVNTVKVEPDPFIAFVIGEKTKYNAVPLSAPDACSAFGQRLSPWQYGWNWSSANTQVAEVTNFAFSPYLNPFCGINCLPLGSTISRENYQADRPLCGNRIVDPGEDCDIAYAGETAGVSCNYNCLRPGNTRRNVCGGTNKTVDLAEGEECDPNDPQTGPYCNSNCTWKGSSLSESTTGPWCGSGSVTVGEDCDVKLTTSTAAQKGLVINKTQVGCSQNCLHLGTSLSRVWCDEHSTAPNSLTLEQKKVCQKAVSVCGNGLVESGESCEIVGNPTNKQIKVSNDSAAINVASSTAVCSDKCLLTDICDEADILSPYRCQPGFEGCSKDCTPAGSSMFYRTPAMCGDGISGTGEFPICEVNPNDVKNVKDKFGGNPVQLVTAVGLGTVDETTSAQQTQIRAQASKIFTNKIENIDPVVVGSGDYKLQCGNTEKAPVLNRSDLELNDCRTPGEDNDFINYGVATNSCCYLRGFRTAEYPADGSGLNNYNFVCPNTYLEVDINRPIVSSTIKDSIYIARGITSGNCSSTLGEREDFTGIINNSLGNVTADPYNPQGPFGFIQRIWLAIKNFFLNLLGMQAYASHYGAEVSNITKWCVGKVTASNTLDIKGSTSTISLYINDLLDFNTVYAVIIKGGSGNTKAGGAGGGLRDLNGVGIKSADTNNINDVYLFKTGDKVCKIKAVKVNPESALFTKPFATSTFRLQALSTSGDQLIVPTPKYNWVWEWGPRNHEVFAIPADNTQANQDLITVGAKGIEGYLTAYGQARIIADATESNITPTNTIFSAPFDLTSYFCANPWPEVQGDGSWKPYTDENYNFSFKYCADAGVKDSLADDLPYVRASLELTGLNNAVGETKLPGKCEVSGNLCGVDGDCGGYVQWKSGYPTREYYAYNNEVGFCGIKYPITYDIANLYGITDSYSQGLVPALCVNDLDCSEDPTLVAWKNKNYSVANYTLACATPDNEPGVVGWVSEKCTFDTMKKYLFTSAQNDDAIGIQIFKNPKGLSASQWYKEQFKDAKAPQIVKVAGYDAVTDGNNYYVRALNTSTTLKYVYQNIYAFSLSKGAQGSTKDVFVQIIDNLNFNVNLKNYGQCGNEQGVDSVLNKSCQNNFDCAGLADADICRQDKDKFLRDWQRVQDLQGMQSNLLSYYNSHDLKYPDLKKYKTYQPVFSAEAQFSSYLPGYVVSMWPSWGAFGQLILGGSVPRDPINYWNCPTNITTAEGIKLNPDTQTCWDAATLSYYVTPTSSVYEYWAVTSTLPNSADSYRIYAPFEYLTVANYSNTGNILYGLSNLSATRQWAPGTVISLMGERCGDGKVNSAKNEECDPPGSHGELEDIAGVDDKKTYKTCDMNCHWTTSTVQLYNCGNSMVEPGEVCDDGKLNGTYGHCNGDCQGTAGQSCGNGRVDGDTNQNGVKDVGENWLEFCDVIPETATKTLQFFAYPGQVTSQKLLALYNYNSPINDQILAERSWLDSNTFDSNGLKIINWKNSQDPLNIFKRTIISSLDEIYNLQDYNLFDSVGMSYAASSSPQKLEINCSDGLDNDGDGKIDCADTDCSATYKVGDKDIPVWCQRVGAECGQTACGGSCGDTTIDNGDGQIAKCGSDNRYYYEQPNRSYKYCYEMENPKRKVGETSICAQRIKDNILLEDNARDVTKFSSDIKNAICIGVFKGVPLVAFSGFDEIYMMGAAGNGTSQSIIVKDWSLAGCDTVKSDGRWQWRDSQKFPVNLATALSCLSELRNKNNKEIDPQYNAYFIDRYTNAGSGIQEDNLDCNSCILGSEFTSQDGMRYEIYNKDADLSKDTYCTIWDQLPADCSSDNKCGSGGICVGGWCTDYLCKQQQCGGSSSVFGSDACGLCTGGKLCSSGQCVNPDPDADGYLNVGFDKKLLDTCPDVNNTGDKDSDGDGVFDSCDTCPAVNGYNPGQYQPLHYVDANNPSFNRDNDINKNNINDLCDPELQSWLKFLKPFAEKLVEVDSYKNGQCAGNTDVVCRANSGTFDDCNPTVDNLVDHKDLIYDTNNPLISFSGIYNFSLNSSTEIKSLGNSNKCEMKWSHYNRLKQYSCSYDCQTYGQYCGDKVVQADYEQCDDGANNGQSTSKCTSECVWRAGTPEGKPVCGDGTVQAGEECDDGNKNGTDGYYCSKQCKQLPKFCGNGKVDPEYNSQNGNTIKEVCDEGTVKNGVRCTAEYGKECRYCSADCKKIITVDPIAYCGNGKIDFVDTNNNGNFDTGEQLLEKCDVRADGVALATVRIGSMSSSYPLGSNLYLARCSDKDGSLEQGNKVREFLGNYSCNNNCQTLVDTCVTCGKADGGAVAIGRFMNVLAPQWMDESDREFGWPPSGSSIMLNLYYGNLGVIGGRSIIRNDKSSVFNLNNPSIGIGTSVTQCSDYKIKFQYGFEQGDYFDYPINNETDKVENEYVISPPVSTGTVRVVVRWTDKENQKGVKFQGIVYNQGFAGNGAAGQVTFADAFSATDVLDPENGSRICDKYDYVNDCLGKHYNGVYVHPMGNLPHTYVQSFTINTYKRGITSYNYAFVVQELGKVIKLNDTTSVSPILPYLDGGLEVEVYTHHEGSSIYKPDHVFKFTRDQLKNADQLVGNNYQYWHPFDLVYNPVNAEYQVDWTNPHIDLEWQNVMQTTPKVPSGGNSLNYIGYTPINITNATFGTPFSKLDNLSADKGDVAFSAVYPAYLDDLLHSYLAKVEGDPENFSGTGGSKYDFTFNVVKGEQPLSSLSVPEYFRAFSTALGSWYTATDAYRMVTVADNKSSQTKLDYTGSDCNRVHDTSFYDCKQDIMFVRMEKGKVYHYAMKYFTNVTPATLQGLFNIRTGQGWDFLGAQGIKPYISIPVDDSHEITFSGDQLKAPVGTSSITNMRVWNIFNVFKDDYDNILINMVNKFVPDFSGLNQYD